MPYSCKKIIGVSISVVGACLWIQKDFHTGNDSIISSDSREIIYGDLLAIASALLYGLNDVLLEYTVKANNDRIEYLGMIGLFGFLFSCFVQAPILETKELSNLLQNFSSIEFRVGNATILNLSLQSSPLWAVILTMFLDVGMGTPDWDLPPTCFFVALAMVICGMFLYEAQPLKK
eukprot:CCRYP_002854-RA/>CCRYP_002854-RA protein AED:0.42 eAED:0.40 QI:0/0/0/1/1/1/2/0/175